jgi:NAD+ synthase (glutamine-hydrolysing)
MDFIGNEKRIIESINIAKSEGGKIILLPELCTTGYSCQDHFYESETYMLSMNIVRNICNSDLTNDIMLVLGIPVIHNGVKYNTMTFISNGKIILIRPKINLADDGNYREARWFTSWSKEGLENFELEGFQQKSAPIGVAIINCNGVKIAAEVCEELWIPQSMNIPLYLNDTDIILNSSGSHFEMNKIQKRIDLLNAATKRSGGAYIYSNMKGCDGERLYFDGGSMIGINGKIVALEERFNLIDVQVLTYPINLDDISEYRLRG